jgi:hypothetical protein
MLSHCCINGWSTQTIALISRYSLLRLRWNRSMTALKSSSSFSTISMVSSSPALNFIHRTRLPTLAADTKTPPATACAKGLCSSSQAVMFFSQVKALSSSLKKTPKLVSHQYCDASAAGIAARAESCFFSFGTLGWVPWPAISGDVARLPRARLGSRWTGRSTPFNLRHREQLAQRGWSVKR